MTKKISQAEFIALMALMMSYVAISIDAMLPALELMGEELGFVSAGDRQLIISMVFMGMGFGFLVFGPLSDSYGRRPILLLGTTIFALGCLVSYFSFNLETMLAGRLLQGFGGASARILTLTIIRDLYSGNKMAKIVSMIMTIFILIPAVAPSIGQGILFIGTWHDIFAFMFATASVGMVWFYFRQEESLHEEYRLTFSIKVMFAGAVETLKHPVARAYTLAGACVFGAFVGYLGLVQPILQVQYGVGTWFSIYFGGLALTIGVGSTINAKIVETYGMAKLCNIALVTIASLSCLFSFYAFTQDWHPPLPALMAFFAINYFCFGILFGNFNALAMEPLGHIAGVANSVMSALQTLLAVLLGGVIAYYYDGTVKSTILGFLILSLAALVFTLSPPRNRP